MEPKPARFLQLLALIGFVFIGTLLTVLLILLSFRFLMAALDQIPWLTYIYMGVMLCIPPVLFCTVFYIFFKRTGSHPSKPVRLFSKSVFILAIAYWLFLLGTDLVFFLKNGYGELGKYETYNLIPLFSTVALIFFMGVLQALTTEKEKDWMDKYKDA
jgi:hypothetical protein